MSGGGLVVVLRTVQDPARVPVAVMGPIRDRAQRRARGEMLRLGEQRHEGDEPAVGTAIDADAGRVHALVFGQVPCAVHLVGQVLAPHVAVNGGPPIPSITARGPEIDVEDREPLRRQQVVEHVLAIVARPAAMPVLVPALAAGLPAEVDPLPSSVQRTNCGGSPTCSGPRMILGTVNSNSWAATEAAKARSRAASIRRPMTGLITGRRKRCPGRGRST
jgi:hypothetical protein